MRKAIVVFLTTVLIACMAGLSFAGVKITLKNGRTIIAESCRDMKGTLLCVLEGGTFEIDRQEIANMQEVKVLKETLTESSDESKPTAVEKSPDNGKQLSPEEPSVNGSEGMVARGLTSEQMKRLDQINERKTIIQPEQERLINEREQLNEEARSKIKGRNTNLKQRVSAFNLQQRIADIETTITNLNDELTKLNEEEQAILSSSAAK
ncbi:MAG: hypothetical protein HZB62_13010 [Nitrospirae bacterium]|nr:hypothetical protein [Nitrospirota bacterium]